MRVVSQALRVPSHSQVSRNDTGITQATKARNGPP